MKILEVIFRLSSGGAERFVVDLSNQLATNGHDVQLLTLQAESFSKGLFYADELNTNIQYTDLGCDRMGWAEMWKVYRFIKNANTDIVHLHLFPMPFFCVFSILLNRIPRYVVTQHTEADSEKREGGIKFWIKKMLIRQGLIHLVAIGQDNYESIKRIYHSDSKLIINGRRPLEFSDKVKDVAKEIELYRSSKNTVLFINIARFHALKNHHRLIRCFNHLISRGYDLSLIIIGAGFNSKDATELVLSADSKIHFLGEKHNIADYLAYSDCFCLSSDVEGMPITLLEALSCGCVPVGTPCSGFKDVIINGVNGFVSKDFTDVSFEDTIIEASRKYMNISRKRLQEDFEQNYTMKACAEKYECFFKDLIN